jgi:hypothetical protein
MLTAGAICDPFWPQENNISNSKNLKLFLICSILLTPTLPEASAGGLARRKLLKAGETNLPACRQVLSPTCASWSALSETKLVKWCENAV